ncbi:MAG: PAS domain S-box protein, partial [Verrucomicrobia bacterium]|nr:PAS domain S-box protein [Verrucomicrobiota bacterium]
MNSERVVPIAGTFESLENFQRLFREHPVSIMIIEKRTGFFLFANPAAVQRYGYGVEEFLNLTADQVIERKEATLFFDGNLPVICQHRTKSGSVFQAASHYQEIYVEGVVAYLVFNDDHGAKDVAKLQNREQAELLNLASDAIMVHDLEHRLLFWNHGATRLYGWTVEDAVGLRTLDLFVREKIQMLEAREQLIKDGSWSGQFSHATKDGREVIVSSRWTLVRDGDGYPTSVLTI